MNLVDAKVATVLAEHGGVITLAQAFDCGLTRRQVHHRVKSGRWEAYARGVFFSVQHDFDEAAKVRAVVHAHSRGIADRTTAAWWHGMTDTLHRPLTLCVPHRSHRTPDLETDVSLIHRAVPAEDLAEVRGVSVTGPALTVIGALELLPDASAFLDRVLQQNLVTTVELTEALDRNKGMHGAARARRLLATLEAGAESEAERLFVELLKVHQITGWVQQYRFGGKRLDFAWPAERLAVEINGWAYHRNRERFESDNAKVSMLAAAGWLTLSFTWRQLTDEPEECIAQVAAALRLRRSLAIL